MRMGFSTGSLALNDFRKGLRMAAHGTARAVELSALREDELDPLIDALESLEGELKAFDYISFHAPSRREKMSECELVTRLDKVAERGWAIIVHPDVIEDYSLWRKLGHAVCVENMDKRKHFGRTAAQLAAIFRKLPEATFCFDIGHARQVDPTMQEAKMFLQCFQDRLRQVHMSYVNSQSHHERLNFECLEAFRRLARQISDDVPVILETPVSESGVDEEIEMARSIWNSTPVTQ